MSNTEYQTFWKESKVVDLHNDLLSYLLASSSHSPYDTVTRSSIPQLREGGIGCLAVVAYAETGRGSQYHLARQTAIFASLPERYPEAFCHLHAPVKGRIAICLAIENCSTFVGEDEPLERGIRRLNKIFRSGIRPLYVSLTWNHENRFGGGSSSRCGLKSDGERILDVIQGHVTAIDLSHTSDRLAYDILSYLDRTKSSLKVIASHSSFRHVSDVPRNLPDEIAKEICRRGGVIGLTCINYFIGKSADDFYKHIEHALSLGIKDSLAIGADFFCPHDLLPNSLKANHFFPEIADSSSLRAVLQEVGRRFGTEVQEGMAWKNARDRLFCPALA